MKNRTEKTHRQHAREIWQAGVEAVDSVRLLQQAISLDQQQLRVGEQSFSLSTLGKVLVVGAGKAGTGMAAGFEAALPADFLHERVTGWINVPADCVPEKPLQRIHQHPARPAGINEPTVAGVQGTEHILQQVSQLEPHDLCLVLISGGGSALLPAPVTGITLEDKLFVTRELSRAGATIEELNLTRSALSRVKGGGLLRACRANVMIGLIISDVVGNPLRTIASGPTVDAPVECRRALEILQQYLPNRIPERVEQVLQQRSSIPAATPTCQVFNKILGSNRVALQAAGQRAEELGYRVISLGSENTGVATELSQQLVHQALEYPFANDQQPLCLLCGGETVVPMSDQTPPGKGGRNQEVAVSAVQTLQELQQTGKLNVEITLLAAGTDGEDGPTDAAGGFADSLTIEQAQQQQLKPAEFLANHNAYPFLSACDSLLITGPTHTNVMDLAVVLVH